MTDQRLTIVTEDDAHNAELQARVLRGLRHSRYLGDDTLTLYTPNGDVVELDVVVEGEDD